MLNFICVLQVTLTQILNLGLAVHPLKAFGQIPTLYASQVLVRLLAMSMGTVISRYTSSTLVRLLAMSTEAVISQI